MDLQQNSWDQKYLVENSRTFILPNQTRTKAARMYYIPTGDSNLLVGEGNWRKSDGSDTSCRSVMYVQLTAVDRTKQSRSVVLFLQPRNTSSYYWISWLSVFTNLPTLRDLSSRWTQQPTRQDIMWTINVSASHRFVFAKRTTPVWICGDISSCFCGDQISNFKPNHDVFLTITNCVFFVFVLPVVLLKRTQQFLCSFKPDYPSAASSIRWLSPHFMLCRCNNDENHMRLPPNITYEYGL